MIRGFSSWQTTIADLALILFLLTAAALSAAPDPAEAGNKDSFTGLFHSELANASAVYRPGAGAPPLAQWLADQQADPRQRLTILVRYATGGETEAAVRALELLAEAGPAALSPRVVMEPGAHDQVLALLAYDQDADQLARPLH